jgi:hypothetical protein
MTGISISADGSIGFISCSNTNCYYFTWNGTNYSTLTATLTPTNLVSSAGCDMSADGNTVVTSYINNGFYFSKWNGTNYNPFTFVNTGYCSSGIGISPDSSIVAYSDFNIVPSSTSSSINKLYNSLTLNGTNQYGIVNDTSVHNYTTAITLEAWIKTSGSPGDGQWSGIINKERLSSALDYGCYGLELNLNRLAVYDWTNGGTYIVPINLNDNIWHHVAFSCNSGVSNGSSLYVDGVQKITFTYKR